MHPPEYGCVSIIDRKHLYKCTENVWICEWVFDASCVLRAAKHYIKTNPFTIYRCKIAATFLPEGSLNKLFSGFYLSFSDRGYTQQQTCSRRWSQRDIFQTSSLPTWTRTTPSSAPRTLNPCKLWTKTWGDRNCEAVALYTSVCAGGDRHIWQLRYLNPTWDCPLMGHWTTITRCFRSNHYELSRLRHLGRDLRAVV